MLIERLIVRKTKPTYEKIRDIKFNLKGLSLIVDNTSNVAKDSGNNVGKTTAIKVIDLCLGANSPKELYFDQDMKSENIEIKNFLKDNKVEAELILLDPENEKRIRIIRQLYTRGKRLIDGLEYPEKKFENELKKIIFGLEEVRPTLRQLIPKFIRANDTTSDNMIKYLHGSTTNDTYDTIYLFLFKILENKLLSKKDTLATDLKECEKKLKLYEKDDNILSLDSLEQRKVLLESELNEFNIKRKQLNYMETYKEELENKRNLMTKINELEQNAQMIEFDINLINKNIENLNNEKSSIDLSQIKNIYNEAKAYIGNMDKTFNDVVEFHNTMIQNRIDFIKIQLENKNKELESIIQNRNTLLEEKKKITVDMLDEGLLEELNVLNAKIENLNAQIGGVNQSIKILVDAKKEQKEINDDIKEISSQMDSENIKVKIGKFNAYFSAYCEKLYGEKYYFAYNSDWKQSKGFPVRLNNLSGSVGTGMKKGIIVAFDLAYTMYANEMEIKSPKFVIHDKLENTHINQLKTIFDLCNDINGQYIIPILRERVDKVDKGLIDKAKVLELSTDNKFFKI
ncbi:hypothetical protein AL713_02260 [Clostridium botulinum]|uniref:DUF2326 domain-containing protein n=1 Tax=Clostridium botulinum TaxID=1491 RepID=UPI00099C8435|nr:DUF2326 domain-containing protein [Clostridium botulinum]OPD34203.1 hypothetical protein AL713_02260 [Clostridium botulinum]